MADARTTDDLSLTCKQCRHGWTVAAPRGGTMGQGVAWCEEQRCPGCGAWYELTFVRGDGVPAGAVEVRSQKS